MCSYSYTYVLFLLLFNIFVKIMLKSFIFDTCKEVTGKCESCCGTHKKLIRPLETLTSYSDNFKKLSKETTSNIAEILFDFFDSPAHNVCTLQTIT